MCFPLFAHHVNMLDLLFLIFLCLSLVLTRYYSLCLFFAFSHLPHFSLPCLQPPFPAMNAAPPPPPPTIPSPRIDLTEAMRQLRVTLNVSVNEDGVNKQGAGLECNAGGNGETKCHAEEKDGVMSFPCAAAPRNFSEIGAMDSRSIGNMGVGSALNGLQPDFDVCVA